jgi:hypothetical protein
MQLTSPSRARLCSRFLAGGAALSRGLPNKVADFSLPSRVFLSQQKFHPLCKINLLLQQIDSIFFYQKFVTIVQKSLTTFKKM